MNGAMSAIGTKRTLASAPHMSAFDPKRTSPWTWVQLDPRSRIWNVRPTVQILSCCLGSTSNGLVLQQA